MTEQNSPSAPSPEPVPPQPAPPTQPKHAAAPAVPPVAAPAQPGSIEPPAPAAPLVAADAGPVPATVAGQQAAQVPQQAFGAAPAAPATESFGAAPTRTGPIAPAAETFGTAPGSVVPAQPGTGAGTFGTAPQGEPPAATQPERKKGARRLLSLIGAIILAILVAGGVFLVREQLGGNPLKDAVVGDCIGNVAQPGEGQDVDANGAKLVDCASSDALYKVEGRLEDKTEAQAKADDVCDAFPSASANFRAINPGGKGFVLCLAPIK